MALMIAMDNTNANGQDNQKRTGVYLLTNN